MIATGPTRSPVLHLSAEGPLLALGPHGGNTQASPSRAVWSQENMLFGSLGLFGLAWL